MITVANYFLERFFVFPSSISGTDIVKLDEVVNDTTGISFSLDKTRSFSLRKRMFILDVIEKQLQLLASNAWIVAGYMSYTPVTAADVAQELYQTGYREIPVYLTGRGHDARRTISHHYVWCCRTHRRSLWHTQMKYRQYLREGRLPVGVAEIIKGLTHLEQLQTEMITYILSAELKNGVWQSSDYTPDF